jgi:hypothetical protein
MAVKGHSSAERQPFPLRSLDGEAASSGGGIDVALASLAATIPK